MAEKSKNNRWNKRLSSQYLSSEFSLFPLGLNPSFKTEEPKDKEKLERPAANPFMEWARKWKEGDPLPIVPPSKTFVIDRFPNKSNGPYGLVDSKKPRKKSINEIGRIAVKGVLGPSIRDFPNAISVMLRMAKARGIPIDDQNKLRCPAGTPAANQFTDLQMSNCLVPSAATAAGNIVDTATNASQATASKIRGSIGDIPIGTRETKIDKSTGEITEYIIGVKEIAQRFLITARESKQRYKTVRAVFGEIRTDKGAKKAIIRAFPNVDRDSIDSFLSNYEGLTGKDLVDYINIREQLIASLLWEAMQRPDIAEASIVFNYEDDMEDAIRVDVALGMPDDILDRPGKSLYAPFTIVNFNPNKIVNIARLEQGSEGFLAMGSGNNPDELVPHSVWAQYVGSHEFGHIADFYYSLQKKGINPSSMDFTDAVKNIVEVTKQFNHLDSSGNPDVFGAYQAGTISPDQFTTYLEYQELMLDLSTAQNDKQKGDAFEKFYAAIATSVIYNTGIWDDELHKAVRIMLGTTYAQSNHQETRAELFAAASFFPDLLQSWIDDENNKRAGTGMTPLPSLQEMLDDRFKKPSITPYESTAAGGTMRTGQRVRELGRGITQRRIKPIPSNNIEDTDIEDYAESIVDAMKERARRRIDEKKKNLIDTLFAYYTPDEMRQIMASIPQTMRNNVRFISGIIPVPQAFIMNRKPNGGKTQQEQRWQDLFSEAIQNDWIDFTALTSQNIIRGRQSPIRTIVGATQERQRIAVESKNKRRQAVASKKKTNSLIGAVSQNSNNRAVRKLGGSMGSPSSVESSVQGSPEKDTVLKWGDTEWSIPIPENEEAAFNEVFSKWSGYEYSYGMRYVSASMMGLDEPISDGFMAGDDELDIKNSVHKDLISGTLSDKPENVQNQIRDMVESTAVIMERIASGKQKTDTEMYRGISFVEDTDELITAPLGSQIAMGISSFTPRQSWAEEYSEARGDTNAVLLRLARGANVGLSPDAENSEDDWWEALTQGKFIINNRTKDNTGRTVVDISQSDVFNPQTGNFEKVSLSGKMSDTKKIGTVTDKPVETLENEQFRYSDSGLPAGSGGYDDGTTMAERSMPVFEINDEKIAFGPKTVGRIEPEIKNSKVKLLPVNPYEITGKSEESQEGREYALLWFSATAGQNIEDPENSAKPLALLYAASRGDEDAQKELERLAKIGNDDIEKTKQEQLEASLEFMKSSRSLDGKWDWNFEYPELAVNSDEIDPETGMQKRKTLDIDDIFMVHQTSYEPPMDEEGNIILKPAEDFDIIDPETGEVWIDPNTGLPGKTTRGTVHFSLNHLVGGHMYRPTPGSKTYAIIVPLRSVLEQNEGALDNLYAVDTYMTPKPGEGLKLPAGSVRVVEMPSLEDFNGEKPEGNPITDWSKEDQERMAEAYKLMQEESDRMIYEMLQQSAKAHHGSDTYKVKVFSAGMHGSSEGIDRRIRYIASGLGVHSGKHDGSAIQKFEGLTSNTPENYRQVSNIANSDYSPLWTLSKNARLRLANNDRFTTGTTRLISKKRAFLA